MATRRPVLYPVPPLSGNLSSLTNFAEFSAFRALFSPVLCRVPLLPRYIGPCPEGLGARVFCALALQFKGWVKTGMLGFGIWIVIRAECGYCRHILVPAVVN